MLQLPPDHSPSPVSHGGRRRARALPASSTAPFVCARGRRCRPATRRCRPWGRPSWLPHKPLPRICPTRMPWFGRSQRGAWWKPSACGPHRGCPGGTAAGPTPETARADRACSAPCPCRRCGLQGRGRAKPRRADGERGAGARGRVEALGLGRGAASPQARAVRARDRWPACLPGPHAGRTTGGTPLGRRGACPTVFRPSGHRPSPQA